MIDATKIDGVSVLRMTDGENRLNGPFVNALVGKAPATVAAIKTRQHRVPLAVLDAGS